MWFQGVFKRFIRGDQAVRDSLRRINGFLAELSMESARALARVVLNNPDLFRTIIDPVGEVPAGDLLAPQARMFVSEYRETKMRFGDFLYSRSEVGPSSLLKGAVKLAIGTAGAEVVVLAGQEDVYIIDGTEPRDHLLDDRYSSIWHYILWQTMTVHPEMLDQLRAK